MKKTWNGYRTLWREESEIMLFIHFIIIGDAVIFILLVRNPFAGAVVMIVWLLALAAIVRRI